MKSAISLFALLLISAAFAEKQPFERYQSIVDRQMFGPLPPGFDPTKSPNDVQKSSSKDEEVLTKDQEKLKSAIRFFVIDTKADGSVAVGFTDNSDPKAPKSYYLKVGESRDGWEVKEADSETATMTIAKDEVEVTLKLGGNSATGGGTSAATPAVASVSGNGQPNRPGLLGGGLLGGVGSLRAGRMQRQQEAAAAEAKQQEAKAAEAAKEAERQAQAEEEKRQREAERAEQRQQLLAIQEELKKVREAKAAAAHEESANEGDGNADNEAQ